ncbi:MAG: SUMF1/EgtB/PvdO family nonheme iron enzyme [Paludibacteraceae bacterium]|nr:SUMF1/EgtB/PvdO family nonheme iron enzyme [Paludibacteraceae bacterium]
MSLKNIFLVLCVFAVSVLSAQKLQITNFRLDDTDQSANRPGSEVFDIDDNPCALLRLQTVAKGFTLDMGTIGYCEIDESRIGEIWIWLRPRTRFITIHHPQLGSLVRYEIPVPIESKRTYYADLIAGEVKVLVSEAVTEQYVKFYVEPKDALVTLDDNVITLHDGYGYKMMRFGEYDYRVDLADYHPNIGKITVNDPDHAHEVRISLKPAFGWVEVERGIADGAAVYIDNRLVGKAPLKSHNLSSGSHRVKVIKEKYAPWEQTVTIQDAQTVLLSPQLTAQFSRVTFVVRSDSDLRQNEGNPHPELVSESQPHPELVSGSQAEIYINDQRYGIGKVIENLAYGQYVVEARLAGHITTTRRIEITPDTEGQVFELQPPTPVYGRLQIESNVPDATVLLDGLEVGQVPLQLRQVLIGQHILTLQRQGYKTETKQINVDENATVSISIELAKAEPERNQQNKQNADRQVLVKEYKVNGVSFTMVQVEGGTFMMGEDMNTDKMAYKNEGPVHQVTLNTFMIGETEVTQALWRAVMGTGIREQAMKGSSSTLLHGEGDNLPMYYVNYEDCQAFIRKLNSLTGLSFRLPTEAEWEYAARGGQQSAYKYAGGDVATNVAWCQENADGTTHPVAQKRPNELTIYDMSGNVWEWCQDWYGPYSSAQQTNPRGASGGAFRVFRGGSWYGNVRRCRVTSRQGNAPSDRSSDLGFRLVLVP